jgi:hypothetical protein
MIDWCRTKVKCSTLQGRERLAAGFVKALERLRGA